jgi:hypothetical protein
MSAQGAIIRLGGYLLLWFLVNPVATASVAEYEVDGEIEQTLFRRDGSVQFVTRSTFTVFVKGCAWLIHATEHDEDGTPFFVRETAYVSGTEIEEVGGAFNKEAWKRGVAHSNEAFIFSNNFPVPQQDGYFMGHLWLMFASGCFLANLSTNSVPDVYYGSASFPTKLELISGPGSLPWSIVYLGYPGLPTDATYTATGVTNAGAVQIPSGFVFENRMSRSYAPGLIAPGESAPTYRVRKRAIATVTAVRPGCSRSDLRPQANGKTFVIDLRLPESQRPIALPTYVIEDGVEWLPLEKAKELYIVERKETHRKPSPIFLAACRT